MALKGRITGDDGHAEEITLDVFTCVWEKAGTYQGDLARVNTWITSLARNRSIDVLRREKARPEGSKVRYGAINAHSSSVTSLGVAFLFMPPA